MTYSYISERGFIYFLDSASRAFELKGGGGAGTHPGFGYPLQNSRSCGCIARKEGAVTDLRTLRWGAVRGAFPVRAVVVSFASPRKASWISSD